MDAGALSRVCESALERNRYVYLVHRGIGRDVYPFSIRGGYLYVWCSLHGDREVERMNLENIYTASISGNEIGYVFRFESEFDNREWTEWGTRVTVE
jgi:hypothetical protein